MVKRFGTQRIIHIDKKNVLYIYTSSYKESENKIKRKESKSEREREEERERESKRKSNRYHITHNMRKIGHGIIEIEKRNAFIYWWFIRKYV